jgi:hypothetical protein
VDITIDKPENQEADISFVPQPAHEEAEPENKEEDINNGHKIDANTRVS